MATLVIPCRKPRLSPNGKKSRKRYFPAQSSESPRPKKTLYQKWTEEEKKFIKKLKYAVPDKGWEECADKLNTVFGYGRSAKSCQSLMKRLEVNPESDYVEGCSELPELIGIGVQTDVSFHPRQILNQNIAISTIDASPPNETGSVLRNLLEQKDPLIRETDMVASDHNYSSRGSPPKTHQSRHRADDKRLNQQSRSVDIVRDSLECTEKRTKLTIDEIAIIQSKLSTHVAADLAKACIRVPALKDCIVNEMSKSFSSRPEKLRKKKHGYVSVLIKNNFESLEKLQLHDIVEEFQAYFPELFQMLSSIMLSKKGQADESRIASLIPRICLVYSILLQARNPELSRMQRAISLCLADNMCDQTVFDRMNRLGVCAPYCVTLNVLRDVGKNYTKVLMSAAREGKFIRVVGDNLNFSLGVKHETHGSHRHMEHMFLSTALVSEHLFLDKSREPEIDINHLALEHIMLNDEEYVVIREDVTSIVVSVACKYLPQFSFMKDMISDIDHTDRYAKTQVVPLPCLPYNENKYQDDVKILSWYEDLFQKIVHDAELDPATKFVIGGDQLTRERLSEALLLRLDNIDYREGFGHIGRCVAEFFHLGMNFLEKAIFSELWNEEGIIEMGTLRGESERIFRSCVDPKVMKAYDEDKRFVISFVNAHIIEGLMEFFKLSDRNHGIEGVPVDNEEKKRWVRYKIGAFVDEYIFPHWSNTDLEPCVTEEKSNFKSIDITLADGREVNLPVIDSSTFTATVRDRKPDEKKNYAHYVLEVGLTFIYFLQLVKSPRREKLLPLLKMMMLQLKGHSIKAKYPREILRILVQQYSVMGLQEACQVFYSSFVNIHGKPDSHVPADLVQEWHVRDAKSHIRHMFSNKTQVNISNRTASIPGVVSVASNFDREMGTVVRAKRHKIKDGSTDEIRMMDDLRQVRPFYHVEGRSYQA